MAKKDQAATEASGDPTPAQPAEDVANDAPTVEGDPGVEPETPPLLPAATSMSRAEIIARYLSPADRERIRNLKAKRSALGEMIKGFLFLSARSAEETPFSEWCDEVVASAVMGIENECVVRACRDHSLVVWDEAA